MTLAVFGAAVLCTSLRANSDQSLRLDQEVRLRLDPDLAQYVRTAPAKRAAPVVKEIKVQYVGPVTATIENALANMETRVGQQYDARTVAGDIRNLSAIRNVTNVRIFGEPGTDGVRVIVVIQTKAATVP